MTIRDIAKICNVSISTVSRAINNDPTISAATKERIQQTIREQHYIPNNSARNLKMIESNTVGMLIKGVDNPFFLGMEKYFEEGFEKLKYDYFRYALPEDADETKFAKSLVLEKRLKGMIFLGGIFNYPGDVLKDLKVPVVLCSVAVPADAEINDIQVPTVSIDDEKEAFRAVSYLIQKGHRRIAMLAGREDDLTVSYLRIKGYKRALAENGIPFDPALLIYTHAHVQEYSEKNGYESVKELLNTRREFTAIFSIADRMAIGAYKALYDAGIRIPDQCSVIGFDGIEVGNYLCPALTTMNQPAEAMAKSAMRLLVDQIEGEPGQLHITYSATLLERASVSVHNP